MAELSLSCGEMGTITAKLKMVQVLRSKLLPAITFNYITEDNGKAYKKKDGRWCAAVKVIRSSRKQITVTDGVSVTSLGISQAIPAESTERDRNLSASHLASTPVCKDTFQGY